MSVMMIDTPASDGLPGRQFWIVCVEYELCMFDDSVGCAVLAVL